MKMIFINSGVLIYLFLLRQDAVAVAVLLQLRQQAASAVSVVVRMEVVQGCRNKGVLQQAVKLLSRFEVIQLSAVISEQTDQLISKLYLSNGLKIADALIASTAIIHDAPLLSKNQRDFRFIPGLKLLPYPTA